MLRPRVTKSSLVLALLVVTVAGRAHAEDRCTLHGEPTMGSAVAIYDAPNGGTEIGHFTGVKVALTVRSFDDGSGRSLIETAGFRIRGFVRSHDVPVYTTRAVPVHAGHLAIGEGRRVSVIGSAPGRVHVELSVTAPVAGTFQGWAPCDAVTLAPRTPPGWAPPGGARRYVATRPRLDLYDRPRGQLVASIAHGAYGGGVLFWGGETSEGFLHVEHHGYVVIDAWAHLRDLTAVPAAEVVADTTAPALTPQVVQKVHLKGRARIVRTTSAVTLRAAATEAAIPIGGIDEGVDVIVAEVVAGWASVMPVSLAFAPSGAVEFWARARDLGV